MEATVVASSYSGSFWNLNCLVVLLPSSRRLPAASWLSLTLGQSVLTYKRGVVPECSSLLEITAFHQLLSPHSRSQPSIWLIDPCLAWRDSHYTEHLSFFLDRLTVALRSLLREDHCRYSHRTVTNGIKTLRPACDNIYKKKIPSIKTPQDSVTTKVFKREFLGD